MNLFALNIFYQTSILKLRIIILFTSAMTANSSTAWATGSSTNWQTLQKGFKHMSVEYSAISEKATRKAANEELRVLEELEAFLALLLAYRVRE